MFLKKYKTPIGGLAAVPLGMVFLFSGMSKILAGQDAFAFPLFVPQVLTAIVFTSLPYIELVIGSLLILGIAVKFIASISILLVAGFAISNITLINQGITGCVGCFGMAGSLAPASALLLDSLMALLIMIIIFFSRGSFFNKSPWYLEITHKGRGYV